MALDAFVYCDCFERDNLRSNPPAEIELIVEPSGSVSCRAGSDSAWFAFRHWKQTKACLHPGMILVHHRLGGCEEIELLRSQLQKDARRFPLLLEKVLYSSTHTCDWIPLEESARLTEELKRLDDALCTGPAADALRVFKIKMAELVIAAKHTGKPICF